MGMWMAVTALLIDFGTRHCPNQSTVDIARHVIEGAFVSKTESSPKRFGYAVLFSIAVRKNSITDMLAAVHWANKNTQTAKISSVLAVTIRNP
jgi:hypothetical protein